ncbi:transaldolase [Helicobacter aurati]|uniref:Transaldolase n=1 Tax=Helicobacter aurati TaxID=137778 RepID=A0A3D8J0M1_9HELI|nr:transaldolase [Helicobacter aurati]RDU70715.1 transaldolase [Helicobacter aurati]
MINIWCDFIERGFLQSGFQDLVHTGLINGATTNPSIFANAFKSGNYQQAIQKIQETNSLQSLSKKQYAKAIYEHLALEDVQTAAKILQPLYEQDSKNGLISIEIDPYLCDDIESSIDEGKRLWQKLQCPNVMIKVPATSSGFVIMEKLMSAGIHVNATLVFSKEQVQNVLQAFQQAYKNLTNSTNNSSQVTQNPQGVISVFVSRYDREIDEHLEKALRGKYGICNATDIYQDFIERNNNPYFRILFASTGVKERNEIYRDAGYYVYPLAFDHCVNTLPLTTIQEIDYKKLQQIQITNNEYNDTLLQELRHKLDSVGINANELAQKLLQQGLESFQASFQDALNSFTNTPKGIL